MAPTLTHLLTFALAGVAVPLSCTVAQMPAPPKVSEDAVPHEIVVTAEPLSKLQRELDTCLARHCAPKEDIDRSLAYAEGQFVAGDYYGSRQTLLAARRRNARFAAELPVEVSSLHRANARLAGLNGASDQERIDTFDMVGALKAGLDRRDAKVMLARMEVGDLEARQGRPDNALDTYHRIAAQAHRANLPAVEAFALFRKAALLSAVAQSNASYRSSAREAIAEVERSTDPAFAPFRNGARLIALRMLPAKKQAAAAGAILATIEPVDTVRPLLAYAPPIETDSMTVTSDGSDNSEWADVAYTITSDGLVSDVHPVRTSARLNDRWLAIALKALRERRYVPVKTKTMIGFPRVVRLSFVNDMVNTKGTRIVVRSGQTRVLEIDMTVYPDEKAGSIY